MPKIRSTNPGTGYLDNRYVNVTGDTMTGNLNLGDDLEIYFDTAKTKFIRYDSNFGSLVWGDTYLSTVADLYITANGGADGSGTYEPAFIFSAGGVMTISNNTQGLPANRSVKISFTAGSLYDSYTEYGDALKLRTNDDDATYKLINATDKNGNSQFNVGVNGDVVCNDEGNDADFRVESSNEDNMFVVDAGADVVRIGDYDTNYAQFAIDGELTLTGTARAWKSWDVRPDAVKLPGANPPAEDTKDAFPMLRFNRSTEESVYYIWNIPSDFATGSASVRGHFEFLVENPPSGSGDEAVVMGFEYKKLSDGDVFDFDAGTSSGTITETIADGETAEIIHSTANGTVTTTGWAAGDVILFRFYRDATNVNDTYDNEAAADDNDVWVFDFNMQYLRDKLGEAS